MESLGTKEIMEAFDGLDVLAEFGGTVFKNGEVGVEDITALVTLATKFETLEAAVSGMNEALKEGKDLDKAEVLQIVGRLYGVLEKFKAAKK